MYIPFCGYFDLFCKLIIQTWSHDDKINTPVLIMPLCKKKTRKRPSEKKFSPVAHCPCWTMILLTYPTQNETECSFKPCPFKSLAFNCVFKRQVKCIYIQVSSLSWICYSFHVVFSVTFFDYSNPHLLIYTFIWEFEKKKKILLPLK